MGKIFSVNEESSILFDLSEFVFLTKEIDVDFYEKILKFFKCFSKLWC